MRIIPAEKPSVARDIAAYLGITQKQDGYLDGTWRGEPCRITWAFGHLVGTAPPEAHGWPKDWQAGVHPLIPDQFRLEITPDKGARTQFNIITGLLKTVTEILCATDAGREGELIFRYIYALSGSQAPVQRLRISSLTPEAIAAGFSSLRPGQAMLPFYAAARARSEADWLTGMNYTRTLTVKHKQTTGGRMIPVGRVQTPTLWLIVSRYLSRQQFVKTPFYRLRLTLTHAGSTPFVVSPPERFTRPEDVHQRLSLLKALTSLACTENQTRPLVEHAPALVDLTTLQRVANERYGFSAGRTLALAQSLYEQKHLTYPRTDSAYLPGDMAGEVSAVLNRLATPSYAPAVALSQQPPSRRVFNTARVSDHHGLIPTTCLPASGGGLDKPARQVYELVVERFLRALSVACVKEICTLWFDSPVGTGRQALRASGQTIKNPGWRAINLTVTYSPGSGTDENMVQADQPDTAADTENQLLPPLRAGDMCRIEKRELTKGITQPPALLSESALLALMEAGGQHHTADSPGRTPHDAAPVADADTDSDADQGQVDGIGGEAEKRFGLGTPATRAAIIETLLRREYITRQGKKLVPTPFGISLYELVRTKAIGSARITGQWEFALREIEQGRKTYTGFMEDIRRYLIRGYTELSTDQTELTGIVIANSAACPQCKAGSIIDKKTFYGCSTCKKTQVDPAVPAPSVAGSPALKADTTGSGCRFGINKVIAGKTITYETVRTLIDRRKTPVLKGFTGKSGKPFEAMLVLDETLSVIFSFSQPGKSAPKP